MGFNSAFKGLILLSKKMIVASASYIRALWYVKTLVLYTNKCTILQSVYYSCYLAATSFGVVAVIRELTPKFRCNMQQQIVYNIRTFVGTSVVQVLVKIIG